MNPPQPKSPNSINTLMSRLFLPDELIAEVLSLLPVKSLMRLRCVCKSWKTLISDSTFVKLHHQRSARKRHIALIKYEAGYKAVTIPLSHLLENLSKTIISNSYYRLEYEENRKVIGSCNGLLCFLGYSYTSNRNQDETIFWFHIWNPATRIISKKLGSCHEPCQPHKLRFAFGYDNSTRTYNAVVLSSIEVKIFRFGDNIWRKISSFTPFDFVDTVGYSYANEGVYLRGTVNWISFDLKDVTVVKCVIISLDLGTETYVKLMPPPGAVYEVSPTIQPTIAVLMNCLCFSHNLKETHFVIWQMMEFGVEQSWTQFLKISFQNLTVDNFRCISMYYLFPFCLSENGDTLILANLLEHKAILYNLKNNRVKQATGKAILWWYSKDYVESLTSIC